MNVSMRPAIRKFVCGAGQGNLASLEICDENCVPGSSAPQSSCNLSQTCGVRHHQGCGMQLLCKSAQQYRGIRSSFAICNAFMLLVAPGMNFQLFLTGASCPACFHHLWASSNLVPCSIATRAIHHEVFAHVRKLAKAIFLSSPCSCRNLMSFLYCRPRHQEPLRYGHAVLY